MFTCKVSAQSLNGTNGLLPDMNKYHHYHHVDMKQIIIKHYHHNPQPIVDDAYR